MSFIDSPSSFVHIISEISQLGDVMEKLLGNASYIHTGSWNKKNKYLLNPILFRLVKELQSQPNRLWLHMKQQLWSMQDLQTHHQWRKDHNQKRDFLTGFIPPYFIIIQIFTLILCIKQLVCNLQSDKMKKSSIKFFI